MNVLRLRSLFLIALLFTAGLLHAAEAVIPQYAKEKHLGVGSCSSSTCHGSVTEWQKSNILQNEYVTWTREDAHSKAYKVLFDDTSKRIARNLGLKKPAHEAKICLDCHTDNVAAAQRGEKHQIADGIGCEACHGGAERWIDSHTTDKTSHDENLKEGLYPTEDPVARARLCLSCHFGDENKFVTHRIMGAGHPRMSFELDTFSAIQPAHYQVDEDYARRKPVFSGVQMWAIGQATSMKEYLDVLVDPKRGKDGIFPELVLFDCHSCHHSMRDQRWKPRRGTGLPPGIVRFNDANFIMLRNIIGAVDAGLAKKLRSETRTLHRSVIRGNAAVKAAVLKLSATTEKAIAKVAGHDFSDKDVKKILASIISEGLAGEFQDYAAAEQTTMAAGNVISVLEGSGAITEAQYNKLNKSLDRLYTATTNDDKYKPKAFISALRVLKQDVPK